MIIDKLHENVEKKGHVCVGLDTSIEYIPKEFKEKYSTVEEAVFRFNQRIVDATFDVCSCFKVQIAYYEALGIEGLSAYKKTLQYIRNIGGIVIADIKRGDIAATAQMYAKAHFEGDFESDFITLNPYMGLESIEPYLPYVGKSEKGLFILIKTSNKGAKDIQFINSSNNEKVYNILGEKIYGMGENYRGSCGYSSIGGVVGCTNVEESMDFRRRFNKMFFLIPGYGAQGGKAEDIALYMGNGNGGVVNSSRGILLAYKKHEEGENKFDYYARCEAIDMRDKIYKAIFR